MAQKRRAKIKSPYIRDMEGLIEKYLIATGDQSWTTQKVADWAIANGLWEPQRMSANRQLMRELSRVARQVKITDENGKQVRKYHAFRLGPQQPMLWAEMEKILPEQMNESKTMRRDKSAAGVVQLYLDLEYFNTHHNPGDPLRFDPDFTKDIEERTQSGDYDDSPPPEANPED